MATRAHHDQDRQSCLRTLILAVAPAQLLDIAGPIEVFSQAARLRALDRGEPGQPECAASPYSVECLIVSGPDLAGTTSGLDLFSTTTVASVLKRPDFDTLVVVGGEGARTRNNEELFQRLLRQLAPRVRRLVGVCTGAFVLAAAGLLDGCRVTTHWRYCAELTERYPGLTVDPESIYLRDGKVWTSAGVTAGMDLALALVEEDHGHALALSIARELVLFLRRPGNQAQFSTVLSGQVAASARVSGLLSWIVENLRESMPVAALAAQISMSPRTFARVFLEETGVTPARFVERVRVEEARRRLESSRAGLAVVAADCGFRTEETMRRSFMRQIGTAPGDYRARFQQRGLQGHNIR